MSSWSAVSCERPIKVRIPKIPNSVSSPRETSFAGAFEMSRPLELFVSTRRSARDAVSEGFDSSVEPEDVMYGAGRISAFSSLVLAVEETRGVPPAFLAASRDLIRFSIKSRALPPSSIAFLICGRTILAAVAGKLSPLLIFSATGSLSTIVGIVEAGVPDRETEALLEGASKTAVAIVEEGDDA